MVMVTVEETPPLEVFFEFQNRAIVKLIYRYAQITSLVPEIDLRDKGDLLNEFHRLTTF